MVNNENTGDSKKEHNALSQGANKAKTASNVDSSEIKSLLIFPPNLGKDTNDFGDGTSNILGFTVYAYSGYGYNAQASKKGGWSAIFKDSGDPIYNIYLSIPGQQKVSYGNEWTNTPLNTTAENIGQLYSDFFNNDLSWQRVFGNAAMQALHEAVKNNRPTSASTLNSIQKKTGLTIHPVEEFLFTRTTSRSFNFGFRLIPRNPSELQLINDIIQVFKWASHPGVAGLKDIPKIGDYVDENSNSTLFRLLKYPNVFKIRYLVNDNKDRVALGQEIKSLDNNNNPTTTINNGDDNPWLHKFGPCACTGITINYSQGAQNYVSYRSQLDYRFVSQHDTLDSNVSGAPIYYNLNLTFQEMTLLTKDAINEGY